MTRAKRYEGAELRGQIWHGLMRDHVHALVEMHYSELQDILGDPAKCNRIVRCSWWYNEKNVSYDVETTVYKGSRHYGTTITNGNSLLRHREDYIDFPSDHLKTKLILIAG